MSSEEHVEEQVVSGKDDFPVSQLVVALKGCQTLIPANIGSALGHESSAVATEDDWKKFWDAINQLNVPVTYLIEPPEERSIATTVVSTILLVLQIADRLWHHFRGFDDKAGRTQWTQNLVREAIRDAPGWNYVVVCTRHSTNFHGVRDVDWSVRTYRYSLPIGGINYQLYAFRSGVFSLLGDGGFLNWAFTGRIVSQDPDSVRPRNIVFRA